MSSSESYEVEIKSLLGDETAATRFKDTLQGAFPTCALTGTESQLNHYFEGGDVGSLGERIAPHLSESDRAKLAQIVERGSNISVRTRATGDEVRFVMKASVGGDSSENGVVRAELDVRVPDLTLEELDQEILASGYTYQAKWSRDRETYEIPGATVCLDRNAGYGYLAEFEKVVDDPAQTDEARASLLEVMAQLGIAELPQDRLERMFTHYNRHWPEYYGTDKVFVIT